MAACQILSFWRLLSKHLNQAGERVARNDRYIREMAQILRNSKAQAKRHVVPDAPDPARLIYLANRIKLNDRTTWPTLKELKLTTGQSERTIRQIIKNLRPKKSELVLKTPKRFGPRLVLRILEKSLNLCSTGMDEKTRSNCMVSLQRLQQVVAIRS